MTKGNGNGVWAPIESVQYTVDGDKHIHSSMYKYARIHISFTRRWESAMQVHHPITNRLCATAAAFQCVHWTHNSFGWSNCSSTYDKNQFLLHKYEWTVFYGMSHSLRPNRSHIRNQSFSFHYRLNTFSYVIQTSSGLAHYSMFDFIS